MLHLWIRRVHLRSCWRENLRLNQSVIDDVATQFLSFASPSGRESDRVVYIVYIVKRLEKNRNWRLERESEKREGKRSRETTTKERERCDDDKE